MKPLKSKNLDKHLLNTISYFSFFGYPPSFDEIHTFFPEKIAKNKLQVLLDQLVGEKRLIHYPMSFRRNPPIRRMTEKSRPKAANTRSLSRQRWDWISHFARNDDLDYYNSPKPSHFQINVYTLPQYTEKFKIRNLKFKNLFDLTLQRRKITQKKLTSMYRYIEVLQKIPFIRFAGITGSASMGNCKQGDDVDIFIITSKNCLFISRFFAILFAHIFHVRKGKNSICLNLFFDESDLVIPLQKQTQYVAHEVLQMRLVVNKGQVYERFLKANEWVSHIFPNSKLKIQKSKMKVKSQNIFVNVLRYTLYVTRPMEYILKTFQLAIIRRNKTGLIISPTQLWLFKNDFETRVKNFKS